MRGSRIIIGKDSVIDSFVKIKPVGGTGDLIIGNNTFLNSGCVLYTGNGIQIGSHVSIAANCTFAPVNHSYKKKNKLIQKQGFLKSKGGILIEDDVMGWRKLRIVGWLYPAERGGVIGAGMIIRGEFPGYSISAGNPSRLLGWRE